MIRSGIWPLIKLSVVSFRKDYASSMGGALAYLTLFSIAPLLIIVIAVAGFFLGAEAARGEIVMQLRGLLGDDGATAVQALLESASKPEEGLFATVVSVVLLIVGATSIFAELQSDLDRIWRAESKPTSGLWSLLRSRVLSFGMILVLAFLLLVSLVACVLTFLPYFVVPAVRDLVSTGEIAFGLIITAITWTIFWFARHSRQRGWLN